MADNLKYNQPADGPLIRTTDDATAHHQHMLLEATNGGTPTQMTGDATNGLDVDVTRVPSNMSVNVAQYAGTNVSSGNSLFVQPGNAAVWVLGAGTAAFGKLVANDGVDIGDVTVNNTVNVAISNVPGVDVSKYGGTDVGSGNSIWVQPGNAAAWVLGAGTAAFGKLVANDGVDIGDVTVNNTVNVAVSNLPNVNLSQFGGTNVGSGNSVWVQPGNAATWILGAGTAAFGKLVANDGVDIGDVTVNNTINVAQAGTWTITDGGPGKTLKTVVVSLATTGTVINSVTSKRLKVYAAKIVVSAAISVNFRDGASTLLEGAQPLAANGGFSESVNPPAFLFASAAGQSIDLVISGTGTAYGRLSYFDDDST